VKIGCKIINIEDGFVDFSESSLKHYGLVSILSAGLLWRCADKKNILENIV